MTDVLIATLRQALGRQQSRRMRQRGEVPAELYGHGETNAHLTLPVSELHAAIRHGAHLIELQGAVNESALIKEIQWDVYGVNILHVDLARVSAEETVEVTVHVEIKGTAPGIKEGGILQLMLHDVKILCRAAMIPEKLEARVVNLHVGGQLTAADLELPAGASLVMSPDQVVIQCVKPELEEGAAGTLAPSDGNEPELIRKAKEEEGEAAAE